MLPHGWHVLWDVVFPGGCCFRAGQAIYHAVGNDEARSSTIVLRTQLPRQLYRSWWFPKGARAICVRLREVQVGRGPRRLHGLGSLLGGVCTWVGALIGLPTMVLSQVRYFPVLTERDVAAATTATAAAATGN